MKTTALTLALSATSTAAFAADAFYVGALIGHNSTDIEVSEDWTPSSYDGFSASGADIGVFAGYKKQIDDAFYVAGEVEYARSSADNEITAGADTLKTSKDSSYGVAARLGYDMGQIAPYVRLGYTRAKFEQELSGTLTAKGDESKSGWSVGAGAEVAITDNLALRGEYVRTDYSKITATDGTNTITYDPTEHMTRVGIAYRF